MRLFMAFIATAILAYAYADSPVLSKYDSIYLDCIDYGHSSASQEQKDACHQEAKGQVLKTFQEHQEYLDCIDYAHSDVSFAKEVQCLKQISK